METTRATFQLSRTWIPGTLLLFAILLATGLQAQQTTDKNKKATEAGREEGPPPVTLGVNVDAARKSADLASMWATSSHHQYGSEGSPKPVTQDTKEILSMWLFYKSELFVGPVNVTTVTANS
jgi:hypothetical protein